MDSTMQRFYYIMNQPTMDSWIYNIFVKKRVGMLLMYNVFCYETCWYFIILKYDLSKTS